MMLSLCDSIPRAAPSSRHFGAQYGATLMLVSRSSSKRSPTIKYDYVSVARQRCAMNLSLAPVSVSAHLLVFPLGILIEGVILIPSILNTCKNMRGIGEYQYKISWKTRSEEYTIYAETSQRASSRVTFKF